MGNSSYSITIIGLLFLLYLLQTSASPSVVKFLPGYDGPLPFHLETGYVGVDESEHVQLFYYFIKSERNPRKDPLLLWLTGGHACTSFTGLVFEIGPLNFRIEEYNGSLPTLVSTPHSWTQVASVIFLDLPAGAGFSYVKNKLNSPLTDTERAQQAHQFIRKWLMIYPEFISNKFYVGGDSYSGITVPLVVQEISDGNKEGLKPHVDLQGYVLGNPTTEISFDVNSRVPFCHGKGLISDELFESLERNCEGEYVKVSPSNTKCLNSIQEYEKCTSRIMIAHILKPMCGGQPANSKLIGLKSAPINYLENLQLPPVDCFMYGYWLSIFWANDEHVRQALHVRKESIGSWVRCNQDVPLIKDVSSTVPYHVNLSDKGYRSLIYSGDHDMLVPFMGTEAWIRSLNYSIIDDWRPWYINTQVAGYTRTYSNRMTFTTIKGGGHTAEYTPGECFVMFKRWINGDSI